MHFAVASVQCGKFFFFTEREIHDDLLISSTVFFSFFAIPSLVRGFICVQVQQKSRVSVTRTCDRTISDASERLCPHHRSIYDRSVLLLPAIGPPSPHAVCLLSCGIWVQWRATMKRLRVERTSFSALKRCRLPQLTAWTTKTTSTGLIQWRPLFRFHVPRAGSMKQVGKDGSRVLFTYSEPHDFFNQSEQRIEAVPKGVEAEGGRKRRKSSRSEASIGQWNSNRDPLCGILYDKKKGAQRN